MASSTAKSRTARPLLLAIVLAFSTCAVAAGPALTPGEARDQRLDKVLRRAETYRVFKHAQDFYYDGLWLQARILFLQVQRDGADLGLFREQDVKRYLKLINLKVDRLCRRPDRCGDKYK
ncbi:MAG: hypothetical protein GXP25_08375 [Planctomycetes bacterium]|nr:hypothetical protein [Planctomycetota bacterium]